MKVSMNGLNVEFGIVEPTTGAKFQGRFRIECFDLEMSPEEHATEVQGQLQGQGQILQFFDRVADKAILVASELRKEKQAKKPVLD